MNITVWRAIGAKPWRFWFSRWPWLTLLYLLSSTLLGLVLVPVIVVTFVFLPLWALAVGALERRRVRLLGFTSVDTAHVQVGAGERHSWLNIRMTEAATWREVGSLFVTLLMGWISLALLLLEAVVFAVIVAIITSARRDHIGFVFQAFNLIPSLSARENVALPSRLARRGLDGQRIDQALLDVGLSHHARKRPGELSGGQQQRVAIARVLAARPNIVFADEPTGSLDTANGAEVLRLLRRATTPSSAVVMVTHDLEAAALADRVLVMRDGTIHQELVSPTPDAVFDAVRDARTVVEG